MFFIFFCIFFCILFLNIPDMFCINSLISVSNFCWFFFYCLTLCVRFEWKRRGAWHPKRRAGSQMVRAPLNNSPPGESGFLCSRPMRCLALVLYANEWENSGHILFIGVIWLEMCLYWIWIFLLICFLSFTPGRKYWKIVTHARPRRPPVGSPCRITWLFDRRFKLNAIFFWGGGKIRESWIHK